MGWLNGIVGRTGWKKFLERTGCLAELKKER